jgi:hypothetical protein
LGPEEAIFGVGDGHEYHQVEIVRFPTRPDPAWFGPAAATLGSDARRLTTALAAASEHLLPAGKGRASDTPMTFPLRAV